MFKCLSLPLQILTTLISFSKWVIDEFFSLNSIILWDIFVLICDTLFKLAVFKDYTKESSSSIINILLDENCEIRLKRFDDLPELLLGQMDYIPLVVFEDAKSLILIDTLFSFAAELLTELYLLSMLSIFRDLRLEVLFPFSIKSILYYLMLHSLCLIL